MSAKSCRKGQKHIKEILDMKIVCRRLKKDNAYAACYAK